MPNKQVSALKKSNPSGKKAGSGGSVSDTGSSANGGGGGRRQQQRQRSNQRLAQTTADDDSSQSDVENELAQRQRRSPLNNAKASGAGRRGAGENKGGRSRPGAASSSASTAMTRSQSARLSTSMTVPKTSYTPEKYSDRESSTPRQPSRVGGTGASAQRPGSAPTRGRPRANTVNTPQQKKISQGKNGTYMAISNDMMYAQHCKYIPRSGVMTGFTI